jgi:cytochrome P450
MTEQGQLPEGALMNPADSDAVKPAGSDVGIDTDLINPEGPELVMDPFTAYSRIREEMPLARAGMPGVDPFWIVTRYDDVTTVLNDSRFVVSTANVPGMQDTANRMDQLQLAAGTPPEYIKYTRANMTSLDGPDHLRMRKLVSQAFTPRRVAALQPRIEAVTEELLDQLPGTATDGVVDLLRHFAYPMPFTIMCELIGVPPEDRMRFRLATLEWAAAGTMRGRSGSKLFPETIFDYTRRLIERRRAELSDDLSSALIDAHDHGDRLTEDELVWTIVSLVFAGQETTVHFITNGITALLTHPDQLSLLREQPGLMPGAVDELMRWCGPGLATPFRYAAEDVEIGGGVIRRGEAIMPIIAGGNYDPRAFGDPQTLDITRANEPGHKAHLGFGHGAHYCLGAALARREGEVAFRSLLRRFPDLALAVDPADLQRHPGGMWKLVALPVTL